LGLDFVADGHRFDFLWNHHTKKEGGETLLCASLESGLKHP
jgi:hypothetical protein